MTKLIFDSDGLIEIKPYVNKNCYENAKANLEA